MVQKSWSQVDFPFTSPHDVSGREDLKNSCCATSLSKSFFCDPFESDAPVFPKPA